MNMILAETIHRLVTNIFALLVLLILWMSGNRRKASDASGDLRAYRILLITTAMMLGMDIFSLLLDGRQEPAARLAHYFCITSYYVFHTIPTVYFLNYLNFQIQGNKETRRSLPGIINAIPVIIAIAALASPFTGFLFTLDAGNHYVRGSGFPFFATLQYGLMLYACGIVLHRRRALRRRVFLTLLAYPLLLLSASVIQMFGFGLTLIWPAATLFLVAASTNIENRRARLDHLTGTANRRSLDEELESRIASERSGRSLCGLLMDVDDFKQINDRFGHDAGDRALEDVGSLLLSLVRVDDLVARMGGDEFVLLMDSTDPETLGMLVNRIEAALEKHNKTADRLYRLSLSIGRACYDPSLDKGGQDFLSRLDADMYCRKRQKKALREL
jgi:diguanylate cyclase (GGDEF)-like protein